MSTNQPAFYSGTRQRNVSNIKMVSSEEGITQLKKGLFASTTVSPRSRRKTFTPEKPRWQIAFTVFFKNFLLLIVLLGFVYLLSKLLNPTGYKDGVFSPDRVSEIEGRIQKIENEFGDVRKELMKKIEENLVLENELKKLEAKTNGLHKSLSKLENFKFLTKEDLESFSEKLKLKNSRGSEGSDNEAVSLDEIRNVAREIVFKEIEKHAADGLGRVDYALASAGGVVVSHSEAVFPSATTIAIQTLRQSQKMLQPSFGQPGECFALKGSNGFVEIGLPRVIIPDAVTLEHVSKSVAYDRSTAPRECRIIGWVRPRATAPTTDQSTTQAQPEKPYVLTEFTYDLEKSNAQTFNIDPSVNPRPVNMVRFEFRNNHGASLTCIYRLRVHGQELEKTAV